MNALVKQFHVGGQVPLADITQLGKLTVPVGSYVVFAKADILVTSPAQATGSVTVQVALRARDGVEDQTTHVWERPRNSTHLTETIALNLGVSFEIGGTIEHPIEFFSIELVAIGNPENVASASNVTMTAIEVDHLDL